MEPVQTARLLAAKMDADMTAAAIWERPEKYAYWMYMIGVYQYRAIHNRNAAENTYTPGTPAHAMYHMSFKYAMRAYSRYMCQFVFWLEGGKGKIPPEAECHRN